MLTSLFSAPAENGQVEPAEGPRKDLGDPPQPPDYNSPGLSLASMFRSPSLDDMCVSRDDIDNVFGRIRSTLEDAPELYMEAYAHLRFLAAHLDRARRQMEYMEYACHDCDDNQEGNDQASKAPKMKMENMQTFQVNGNKINGTTGAPQPKRESLRDAKEREEKEKAEVAKVRTKTASFEMKSDGTLVGEQDDSPTMLRREFIHLYRSRLQPVSSVEDMASLAAEDIAAEAETNVSISPSKEKVANENETVGGASGTSKQPKSDGWLADKEKDSSTTLEALKEGFKGFKTRTFLKYPHVFRDLNETQEPKVMIISCCDSRVSPNMILQAHPGDVFTVRNVANLVPPFEKKGDFHGTSAALEYAVCFLKVKHIVVMGHSNCGGIKALMARKDQEDTDFIDKWMGLGLPARERTIRYGQHLSKGEQQCYCEKESINVSLANLLTFPWIKEAVNAGELSTHGWYYNMSEGSLATWTMKVSLSNYEKLG